MRFHPVYWNGCGVYNDKSVEWIMCKTYFWLNIFFALQLVRKDGPFNREVQLPTTRSFNLLRFTYPCQKVQGRNVREEVVKFDDEDICTKNSVSGTPLQGAAVLLYCYYWKLCSINWLCMELYFVSFQHRVQILSTCRVVE